MTSPQPVAAAEPELSLRHVSKRYGKVNAVDDISLDVASGSLVALLGPSGCGKTTTLRMLGGFLQPTSGTVALRGTDVTTTQPHRRDTAMVFQSYALFPHLSVADNIAYGLKRRHVARAERRQRVADTLQRLRLTDLADRRPAHLSGGQQQRVAVGRALVVNPAVLLLDEPFSALDAQLRESTRIELRRLQQDLGITAMFVTHDQQEALSIADVVAVMNNGRLEQVGTPHQVYTQPNSRFVAAFLGAANALSGQVRNTSDRYALLVGPGGRHIEGSNPAGLDVGADAVAIIRPEDLTVTDAPVVDRPERDGTANLRPLPATVELTSFLGNSGELRLRTDDGTALTVHGRRELAAIHRSGDLVHLTWNRDAVRILP